MVTLGLPFIEGTYSRANVSGKLSRPCQIDVVIIDAVKYLIGAHISLLGCYLRSYNMKRLHCNRFGNQL